MASVDLWKIRVLCQETDHVLGQMADGGSRTLGVGTRAALAAGGVLPSSPFGRSIGGGGGTRKVPVGDAPRRTKRLTQPAALALNGETCGLERCEHLVPAHPCAQSSGNLNYDPCLPITTLTHIVFLLSLVRN